MKNTIMKIKNEKWIVISISSLCVILVIFYWWKNKNTLIEGNLLDDIQERINTGDEKTSSGVNYIFGKVLSALDVKKKDRTPLWNDNLSTYKDLGEMNEDVASLYAPRDLSNLEQDVINDNCSKKSLLKSEYAEDICEKYMGDYQTINQKCRGLSDRSCTLTKCCVLMNGNKCVAGDKNGPSLITETDEDGNKNQLMYEYYVYQGQRFPELLPEDNYNNNCGKYADNSTDISPECMIQLFNKAGCANPNPSEIITEDYKIQNSRSTKRYLRDDLTKKALALQNLNETSDPDMIKDKIIKCNGPVTECDKYYSYSKNVSKRCMEDMFDMERITQLKTYYDVSNNVTLSDASLNIINTFITDEFASDYAGYTKRETNYWINRKMQEQIVLVRQAAENNMAFACRNYNERSVDVSRNCMNYIFMDGCPAGDAAKVIDDKYYNSRKTFTRQQLQTELKKITDDLKKNVPSTDNLNEDNTIKCYGKTNNTCDRYYSTDKGVDGTCLEYIFQNKRTEKMSAYNNKIKGKNKSQITEDNVPSPLKTLNAATGQFENSTFANSLTNRTKRDVIALISNNIDKLIQIFGK